MNYTFADLLNIFFRLSQDADKRKTQDDLARALKVGKRTVAGWFAGDYAPRSPDLVEGVARFLGLTAFQVDLLLYAIEPAWVRYGTPHAILEAAEIIRYREAEIAYAGQAIKTMPSVTQIEREWTLTVEDKFATNYRRWGVGTKSNNLCRIERTICEQRYVLTLENQYHEDVFMGGDSSCLAPKIYYLTVMAEMVQGSTEADGYALLFEEISDDCNAMFRVREKLRKISVVQTFDGFAEYNVYLKRVAAPSINPKGSNKLAILAIHDDHWFYINDALVGQHVIPRLSLARVDVGIIAGAQQQVICHFRDFRLYVPQATKVYPTLTNLFETPL